MGKIKIIRITTVPVSLKTLLKGQHHFMIGKGYEVVGISSKGPELEAVAKTEGIRTFVVEMTRTITPIKDLKAVWQLYKIIKKERPAIVHTHTPKAGTVGMFAAWLASVPHRLHTVAGLPLVETRGIKRSILERVEKATYALATKIYPNSKGQYDFILQHLYLRPDKLKVIANGSSNGVNTAYFDPSTFRYEQNNAFKVSLGIAPDDFLFVFVGRMVKDKGINELVRAFVELQQSYLDSGRSRKPRLLLVGRFENELDPLLPETMEIIDSNPDIIYVGYQQDVRPYFAISDCLVFPSYREGFPNVVMQAGAMELPSIVTDINGCNEIVEDGVNGLVIPPKDADSLREAMNEVLYNDSLRKSLKEKSREMIVSRYEQELVWRALLDEYRSLTGVEGLQNQ